MVVRDTTPADFAAVREILLAAFGQPAEAELVEALRRAGDAAVDLVAERDGGIVGHVLLSALQAPRKCLALAPVCVDPALHNQGIGSVLIRAALGRARSEGWQAAFVLGEPGYYARFGFSAEAAAAFDSDDPKPYFMALELQPSALAGQAGRVAYAAPFLDLG